MKITRFGKAVAYLVASAALFAISAVLMHDMHGTQDMAAAYLRSDLYLFVLSAAFLGTSAYSYMAYTRRHREHRGDSLFCLLLGIVTMVLTIVVVVKYGGINADKMESALTAINLNLVLLAVIPAVFLIRAVVLAFTSEKGRPGLLISCGVLLLVMVVIIFSCGLMGMVREEDLPAQTDASDYGELWEPEQGV